MQEVGEEATKGTERGPGDAPTGHRIVALWCVQVAEQQEAKGLKIFIYSKKN